MVIKKNIPNYSNAEKRKYIKDNKVYKHLNFIKFMQLMAWHVFNVKKANLFYYYLSIGKSVGYSFYDAKYEYYV